MDKLIFVIRSAPYNYLVGEHDLYDSFDLVARRLTNPGIGEGGKQKLKSVAPEILFEAKSVFSAPEKRCMQTAELIGASVTISPLLCEVGYKMKNFIAKNTFYGDGGKPDVNKARKNFVDALISRQTDEKFSVVMERIEKLLGTVKEVETDKVVLVSHGFIMKIIEAYVHDRMIKKYPPRLIEYFSGNSETFRFCEGFVLEEINGKVGFVSYIKEEPAVL